MKFTVVLPIHKYNEEIKLQLNKLFDSIEKQDNFNLSDIKVNVVAPTSIIENLNIYFDNSSVEVNLIENKDETDFQSQVNLGVKNCKTKYFTIAEFDDELSETYFKRVNEYVSYYTDVDVFLPIIVEVNGEQKAMKMTNETVWSRSFIGENGTLGYLNVSSLNNYTDFKICGAVFNKSEFLNAGGLKKNIVLTFQYELLLRMLTNGSKIFTIPKIMYKHLMGREGSLFEQYRATLTNNEKKFWFETAKKEANFTTDREVDLSPLKLSVVK